METSLLHSIFSFFHQLRHRSERQGDSRGEYTFLPGQEEAGEHAPASEDEDVRAERVKLQGAGEHALRSQSWCSKPNWVWHFNRYGTYHHLVVVCCCVCLPCLLYCVCPPAICELTGGILDMFGSTGPCVMLQAAFSSIYRHCLTSQLLLTPSLQECMRVCRGQPGAAAGAGAGAAQELWHRAGGPGSVGGGAPGRLLWPAGCEWRRQDNHLQSPDRCVLCLSGSPACLCVSFLTGMLV